MTSAHRALVSVFLVTATTFAAESPENVNVKIDLMAAYQAALEKTEPVAIANAKMEQADYRLDRVAGALFPSVSLIGSYTRQDSPGGTNAALSTAFNPNQSNARINVSQPLFRGLSEYAAIRQAKAAKRASEKTRDAVKLDLFSDIASLYFANLSAQKDVENLVTLEDLTNRRIREVRERVKIGRTRRGDLLAAEAQLATFQANLAQARATAQQAYENLILSTGLPPDKTFADDTTEPKTPPDLKTVLATIETRPDIVASKESLTAADEQVGVAWGGHLPSVDLSGNYYMKRMGLIGEVKWDVGVSVTFPIFAGGTVQAQVREATSVRKESELGLARLRRTAEMEVKSLHARLAGLLGQYTSFQTALTAAEANFKEQNRDYKYGLVTNLDVLQALNTLQETKRSADRVRYEARTASLQLEAATGRIPGQTK